MEFLCIAYLFSKFPSWLEISWERLWEISYGNGLRKEVVSTSKGTVRNSWRAISLSSEFSILYHLGVMWKFWWISYGTFWLYEHYAMNKHQNPQYRRGKNSKESQEEGFFLPRTFVLAFFCVWTSIVFFDWIKVDFP